MSYAKSIGCWDGRTGVIFIEVRHTGARGIVRCISNNWYFFHNDGRYKGNRPVGGTIPSGFGYSWQICSAFDVHRVAWDSCVEGVAL